MNDELEGLIEVSLRRAKLPPAPDSLRSRAASLVTPTAALETKPVVQGRSSRSRPWLLLPAAAILVALVAVTLLLPGTPRPPTEVDGLPVLSVSQVLAQRAAGGLRNQPVAVGGFWTNAVIGHSCAVGAYSELEDLCHAREYGISVLNEPVLKFGRFHQIVYEAKGPHLTPYLPHDLAGLDRMYGLPWVNGEQYPPVPIVVVGHFDDRLADRCQPDRQQECRDRLVVDWIAYFNPRAAGWAEGIPTIEPTPPPPPPTYAAPAS